MHQLQLISHFFWLSMNQNTFNSVILPVVYFVMSLSFQDGGAESIVLGSQLKHPQSDPEL